MTPVQREAALRVATMSTPDQTPGLDHYQARFVRLDRGCTTHGSDEMHQITNYMRLDVAHVYADGTNILLVARQRPVSSAYTPTNVSTDRAYDANATTTDELADVLGTLIADLQVAGILG